MVNKTVVQTVLLYGSDILVFMDAMMKVLEGFYYQINRRITGKTDRHVGEDGWEWPLEEEAIEVAGLWTTQ